MARKMKNSKNTLYTMDVFLVGGPVSEEFMEKNPIVMRTIEIKGNQTLMDLHNAIFDAFDRIDQHLYEFQIGGKGPNDPDAKRYVLPEEFQDSMGTSNPKGDVSKTTIASLKLSVDEVFGYWFDFGDDWWHQINITKIKEEILKGQYPKIINRTGDSPQQYQDIEDY